jgi:hypothetical protein
MSSKYFIWIDHVPMSLWEFSWNFCDFRSIFRAFKQFLDVFWNCFRIKNKFEKKTTKPILPDWAEPVGPTQPTPAQPPGPAGPIQPARG